MKKKFFKIFISLILPVIMLFTAGFYCAFSSFGTSRANALSGNGGIVYVGNGSKFNMTNGSLGGGSATNGGGVYVASGGTFNLSGGEVVENTATNVGNNIYNSGTFTMTGGKVGKQVLTRVDENGNKSETGNYVYFGSYPQTLKASSVTIDESSIDSNGYYLGSDGERYAKVIAKQDCYGNSSKYKFSNGSSISVGTTYYFKVEPIKWKILSSSNGKFILYAEDIIEQSCWNSSATLNYKTSSIRNFINGEFFSSAFSLEEQAMIQTTTVDNGTSTVPSAVASCVCENTTDKVFLLSYKDVSNSGTYGFTNSSRMKHATDFAKANGLYVSGSSITSENQTMYWTRSPYSNSTNNYATMVSTGEVMGGGIEANLGVSPAITVSFANSTDSGYGTYNTGTMNLYGGTVYDKVYTATSINTKMACNIQGTITLGNSATITVEDYAGATPSYTIVISSTRAPGKIVTFLGNNTISPDISKFTVTGYNSNYGIVIRKNSNGYFELALTTLELPSTWKTEVASTDYMTTTVTPANLTSIKFAASVPSGYTKIGTLSTGLPVYKGTTATDIAFVGKKIFAPENSYKLFDSLSKLTTLDMSVLNTSKVTDMSFMFRSCSALTSLDVSGFDTSKVTNMSAMFRSCSVLTSLGVSGFDTSKVTDMSMMFDTCSALTSLDVSGFNTSNVAHMRYMFYYCLKLTSLDLSNFNTSKVTDMNYMFRDCSALTSLDLSSFNMAKVTNSGNMLDFGTSNKIQTLKTPYNNSTAIAITTGSTLYKEDTGAVVTSVPANTTKSLTYVDETPIKTFPSTWKTEIASSTYMTTTVTPANLTSIKFAPTVPSGYTQIGTLSNGLPVYKGTSATDIAFVEKKIYAPENSSQLFDRLSKLTTLDMSVFDTSSATNMSYMFCDCSALTSLGVSGFDTSKVTDMRMMFYNCSALTSLDVSGFNTSNVTKMDYMFYNCSALTSLDVSNFDTSKVTYITCMFYDCSALTGLDLSNFNTSKVTNMSSMFGYCSALTSLDVSGFNTSIVTNMNSMFRDCSALTSLNVSNFDTSKVTDMKLMFYDCSALTSLDVSGFNTSNVTKMDYMFRDCSALTSLDLSSFNMAKVTDSADMLKFGTSNKIQTLKTPYNNSSALAITTGSTLYNVATETSATGVLANTTSSQTLATRFTINLDANGGSCSTSSIVGYYGCSLSSLGKSLPTPTQSGYNFNGWYSPTGSRVTASTVLAFTSSTTLTARWTEITTPTPDPDPPTPPTPPDPDPPTPGGGGDIESAEYIIFTTRSGVPSGLSLNSNYNYESRTFFQTGTTPDVYTNDSGTQVAFVGGYGDLIAPQDCSNMFAGMSSLKWVIFRNYDTFNSTNFTSMFEGCGSLEFVDMLSIQTPNVTSMNSMFKDCSSLRQIALADFDCISLGDASYMFSGCSSLGNNPLYSGSSGNIYMQNEQLGSVPEIKYTYNLQYADYMFAGCGWGTFCMPYLFTDSLSSAGGMFENSTFTALDLSQFLCKNYDFSDICGETQLSVEAISTPRGCNPNNFINSNFNGTYYFANNGSDDTVDVFDQAGIENLVIPFSLCLVSSDVSGNYEQLTYTVKIPEYRDSEIEYLIEKLYQYSVMFTGSNINDFNFQTYHISYNDIYYIIPHPTGDYDETGSEEGSFAGLIGNIGALKDDLVYGDFLNRWAWSTNPSDVEVITWHDDEIPAITLDLDGGDVFCGTTPYQNWYEGPRHLFARVRYLPSVHFTDGRILVGWTDALDMGVDVTYFTNIARLENSSGGDWWESGLKVQTKSVDDYIRNEYWSLPAENTATFLQCKQGKEESVNDLMQLYDENKQDILIPEDKKVTITELKLKKVS